MSKGLEREIVSDATDAPSGVSPRARPVEGASAARHVDVFEAAPCGIVVVDRAGRIVDVNTRALRDLGYERGELIGSSVETLVPDAQRHGHHAARTDFQPGARHRMGVGRYLTARRRDGTTFPAEVALSPVGEGMVAAFIVDVTEQKRAEEALALAEGQLRLTDKLASLGMLAAGVAHEVNNPLTVILASLSSFAPEASNEATLEAIADVTHAAERIRCIVADLQRFSGRDDKGVVALDVRRVLESSLHMAAYATRGCAKIVRDFADVPMVLANASRLEQVFVNLLLNAAHALQGDRAGDKEVRVRTRTSSDGSKVTVEIADTGCGMSQEVQSRLFEPFFTTKARSVGSGLGLSICKRIVSDMGGTIQAESRLGHGTVLRVSLPRGEA